MPPLVEPSTELELIRVSDFSSNLQQLAVEDAGPPARVARWLLDARAVNVSGTNLFLFVCDKASAIVNNDTSRVWGCYPVPGSSSVVGYVSEDFGTKPLLCLKGIRLVWSSTSGNITLANGGPIMAVGGR